jgi:hypothetical protein
MMMALDGMKPPLLRPPQGAAATTGIVLKIASNCSKAQIIHRSRADGLSRLAIGKAFKACLLPRTRKHKALNLVKLEPINMVLNLNTLCWLCRIIDTVLILSVKDVRSLSKRSAGGLPAQGRNEVRPPEVNMKIKENQKKIENSRDLKNDSSSRVPAIH